jgi:hypothetical protein
MMIAGLLRKIKMKIHPPAPITESRVIRNFDMLPEIYQPYFRQLQKGNNGEFPYLVLTPAADKSIRKPFEQLFCTADGTLYIIENTGGNLLITTFPLAQIIFAEVGCMLLFSWLRIHGITTEGLELSKSIEFNSISYPHLIPIMNQIRDVHIEPDTSTYDVEKHKFDFLIPSNYKFMNFGRKSLMGDEKVQKILWEPEIREQWFARLGLPFYRTKSYTHLSILTDREYILIREDDFTHSDRKNHYGGIWQYIPLQNIRSLRILGNNGVNFTLQISLNGNTVIPLTFRNENLSAVEDFIGMATGVEIFMESIPA